MNTHLFDNIGCSFLINDNNDFIIGASLPGYKTLGFENTNVYIPYLARNINNQNIEWELGVGYVYKNGASICVKREIVKSSSNNDNLVSFNTSGSKQFYLFVNTTNFNTGFNNVFVKDSDFTITNNKGVYIVDVSSGLVHCSLPNPETVPNLGIEFRTVGGDGSLSISDNNGFEIILSGPNRYTSLVSAGQYWVELKDTEISKRPYQVLNNNDDIQALSENNFSSLSDPVGENRSLQYNNNGSFDDTSVYWGSNEQLLFGNSSANLAKNIIPSSGNYPLILNQTKNNSDFVVYGAGSGEKNVFFTYDGKLGINIPTGVRPQTIVHIINSSCQESLRVENRSTCYSADVSIYHRPPTSIPTGAVLSQLKLSSKDNSGNRVDYIKLQGKAKSTNTGSAKGQFDIVVNNGGSGVATLQTNPDETILGYANSNTTASTNNIRNTVGSSILNIATNNIGLSSTSINVSGILNLNNNIVINSGLVIPNLPSDTLLALNANKQLVPATGFKLSGVTANRLLTTDSSGVINGAFSLDTFLPTYGDFTWNKYGTRTATACLRQLTFVSGVPANEYGVGDQIAIIPSSGSTIYRTIDSIEYTNPSTISSLLLDQTLVGLYNDLQVFSVSKGGYLVNQLKTEPGTISDATSIVLSSRPNTDTLFNTRKKDIDFKIYGMEDAPALSIMANASFVSLNSGVYFKFATHVQTGDGVDIDPFGVQVNANGVGQTSTNNSINFSYTSIPTWSGMVTTVGSNGRQSYYGTYDQNGNAYEWVEDNEKESVSTNQYVCGGSWRTTTTQGLRSVISTPYTSNLDDVGFRICAKYGLNNGNIEIPLGLSFVPVSNIDNLVDNGPIFTESSDNRFGINNEPEPTSILNLGKVYNPYQIGKYEITNNQYAAFLNAVAKTDIYSVYDSNMSTNIVGGIIRSGSNGSYEYSSKLNMGDKPVVYVDYLSAIRFINWLHNGAPNHTDITSSTTETGAYTINIAGATTIIKNNDQKYWLPSLNEWHKAAYFLPIVTDANTESSAVIVRTEFPYEVSSGVAASLTVKDYLYADKLIVGNSGTVGATFIQTDVSGNSASINLIKDKNNYKVNIGPTNAIVINENSEWDGSYSTYLSPTGIVLASSGEIKFVSPALIRMSGIVIDKLLTQSVEIIDEGGNIIEGGQFPGPNGGILYKNLEDSNASASNQFTFIEATYTTTDDQGNSITATGVFPTLTNVSSLNPVYKNSNGYLSGYDGVKYGTTVDGIDGECVSITKPGGNIALAVDKIRIGPPIPTFSGTILMHNGEDTAYWAPADYLRADGISWSRYPKRALKLTSNNTAEFISRNQSIGGTGPVSAQDIFKEFAIDETIAIMNASKAVVYAKVANFVLLDSERVAPDDFFTNQSKLMITFCPPVSDAFLTGAGVNESNGQLNPGSTFRLGYAHSVQKGGYLDMMINQDATAGFNCSGLAPTSQYRFKPSTANTISIRPKVHTSFNKIAEDIDFAIYGYKDTLYNRYEGDIFATGSDGLPSGLNPAFYVNVNVENSVIGNVESGVVISGYLNNNQSLATGIAIDESAKITINTKLPYAVTGIVSQSGYTNSGKLVVASAPLQTYADLTVNGYTFSSGVITNNLTLNNTNNRTYIPNAPLTINSLGQLVSLIPPPPPTIPDAPIALVGAGGNQSVTLNWTAPINTGNAAILDYLVEYSDDDGNTWSQFNRPTSTELGTIVTGLNNGISYTFRVSAINQVGAGPVSQVSSIVIPTADTPSQPLNLTVIRGSLQASLSWSAPLLSGSSNIIDYQIDYARVPDPYSDTLEWITFPDLVGTSTSVVVNGILNGPTYYFRIIAKNSSGNGTPTVPVKSVGTDPEPLPPDNGGQQVSDNWDFGEIVFTGVCI